MIMICLLATTFDRVISILLMEYQLNEAECQCFGHAIKSYGQQKKVLVSKSIFTPFGYADS